MLTLNENHCGGKSVVFKLNLEYVLYGSIFPLIRTARAYMICNDLSQGFTVAPLLYRVPNFNFCCSSESKISVILLSESDQLGFVW